jgi:ribosomal protein S6--L-glutamate ligase
MRIALLSGGDGWHVRDLMRAAAELGHSAKPVDFRRVWAGVPASSDPLDTFDRVIVRTMPPGSLEQVVFRMDRLHALELRGVPILNPPRALEVCVDKYLALVRLQTAGLCVPATIVCQDAEAAIAAFEALGRDVVVKPIFGSEGRGMMRVSDPELAWRTFRTLERTHAVLYIQKFIAHPGWDLRAFVLNGKVLAAMRRSSNGDWRTNVAQGATAESVKLSPDQEELAVRAAEAVGATAAGVDLLPDLDGQLHVIEVNAVPGWKALAPATGVDVARAIIEQVTRNETRDTGHEAFSSFVSRVSCLSCIWEATARKAGNVNRSADFPELTYSDFLVSAAAASPEFALAVRRHIGETILSAIRATRSVVCTNTNLGIVLLLAPLAKVPEAIDLRAGVGEILEQTTVSDAVQVYEAIRLAGPGGMGEVKEQDVRLIPTAPLRDVMALAADRDVVARQYANGFADVFELGVPALLEGIRKFGRMEPAIQHCQLVWLAKYPDSLILRKRGPAVAAEGSERARSVLTLGGLGTSAGRSAYDAFDRWLREDGHARNPGTTADLVTACLFAALRERSIHTDHPF